MHTILKWLGAILIMIVIASCHKKVNFIPNNNNGGYTLTASSSSVNDSIFVMGTIKDLDEGTVLPRAILEYYCQQVSADVNGKFQFKESKRGFDQLILYFRYLDYRSVETRVLPLQDTLYLEVFLEDEHQITSDCE